METLHMMFSKLIFVIKQVRTARKNVVTEDTTAWNLKKKAAAAKANQR